jgi:hypothetical protein
MIVCALFLFLAAILVPAGVLIGLAGRILYQDRELSAKRAVDQRAAAVGQLGRELAARLENLLPRTGVGSSLKKIAVLIPPQRPPGRISGPTLRTVSRSWVRSMQPDAAVLSQSLRGPGIEYLYFPVDSVISIVARTGHGQDVEVASIGNEGMVGLPVFLGTGSTPEMAYAQIAGNSFRIGREAFWEQARQSDPIVKIMRLYAHALIMQITQRAACNQSHSAVRRCA